MAMKLASSFRSHLMVLLLLGGSAAAPPDGPPGASYSARQLRAGLLAMADKIESLSVIYRSYDYDLGKSPKGTYFHKVVIAKSPCFLHVVSAHGHDALDWSYDPLRQACYVTDNHVFNEFPLKRAYSEEDLGPGSELPGTLPNEFFFLATGIWPLDGRPAPRPFGRPHMLREVAEAGDYSIVRPLLERVDGRWCHVLESPDRDRLWLDAERGFALLMREVFVGGRCVMAQRYELEGHFEVAPGVWVPGWIQNIQFDYDAPSEQGRQRKVTDARHHVLKAEVNRAVASDFLFNARPGSLLVSSTGGVQVQPGGLDHLDDLARWVRLHEPPSWPRRQSFVPIGWIAPLSSVLFIAACELRRRRALRAGLRSASALEAAPTRPQGGRLHL
jgi:hypothetical protein